MRSFSEEKIPKTGLRGNRLHLGMRASEVLKLTHKDIKGRKVIIKDRKSVKELEVVLIPP